MTITLATAYIKAEIVKANGIVATQDRIMLPMREKSMVLIPSMKDPLSTHPFAIPAPTTPMT